jgi:hypothetical protein
MRPLCQVAAKRCDLAPNRLLMQSVIPRSAHQDARFRWGKGSIDCPHPISLVKARLVANCAQYPVKCGSDLISSMTMLLWAFARQT